jgi:small subunit ribosomal protein S6
MRVYEELFIVRPDAPEEEIDQVIEQLTTLIASQGGNVDKADKWGVRKLAYRVQKRTEGFYVLLQFVAKPETVMEIERRLRVTDLVLKFLTVRIDEKMKKIESARRLAKSALPGGRPHPYPRLRHLRWSTPWLESRHRVPAHQCLESRSPRAARKNRRERQWRITEAAAGPSARPRDPPVATRRWPPRSNISGARKCAGSASRKSTTLITRT